MLHAATRMLIEKVCDLTENDQAPWRFGPEDGSVTFVTEGYRIEAADRPARFHVSTAAGRSLELADEHTLSSIRLSSGWPTLADRVCEMVVRARMAASKPDQGQSEVPSGIPAPPLPRARVQFGAIPSFVIHRTPKRPPRSPGPEAYRPWS